MSTLVIVALLAFGACLGLGAGFFWMLRVQSAPRPPTTEPRPEPAGHLRFRWRFITLPVVFLVFSAGLVGFFSRLLPAEVAYHFQPDGAPDAWMSRSAAIVWALVPQILLTALALAVTRGGVWLIRRLGLEGETRVDLGQVLLAMGNMIALPQAVLSFAMLRIFGYNAYQTHILPVWGLVLAVMVLGGVALVIFFSRAFRQAAGRDR